MALVCLLKAIDGHKLCAQYPSADHLQCGTLIYSVLTAWQCRCWHGMLSWQIWTLIQKFKILAPVSERSANGSGLVSASSHMLLTDAKVAVAAVFKNGVGWCVAIHSTEHFLCISAKSVVGTSLLFPPLKSKKSTWKAKARVCHCWVCAGWKLLHMLDSLLQAHE